MTRRKTRRPSTADDPRWTSDIKPAPGELKIVQAFVNTAARRKHAEELPRPRALARWLARWRLMPEELELGPADHALAMTIRLGFGALLSANSGATLDEQVVARFENAAADVPLRLRASATGEVYLAPASDGAAALGRLVGVFAEARFGASWPRLKACGDIACSAAFYDTTKNLGGKWCSYRCGNRMAARASRRRRRSH